LANDIDEARSREPVPAALQVRFDDDAPRTLPLHRHDAIIDNPSILQSTTIPPTPADDDGFALGALPAATERAFVDGSLSIRHLPVGAERKARPGAAPSRLSLGAATAFLVAGCCAGAVVGLLQKDPAPVVVPQALIADDVATANAAAAPTTTTNTLPAAGAAAVVDVVTAAPAVVDVATAERALPPHAVADAALEDSAVALGGPAKDAGSPGAATQDAQPVQAVQPRGLSTAASNERAPSTETKATAEAPTAKGTAKGTASKAATAAQSGRLEVAVPRGGRVQKAFALAAPARVVVDIKGAALPVMPDVPGAREVRVGRPQKGVERVVIVLPGDEKPELARAKIAGDRLVVRWRR
jgi:hypothetical protein